MRRFRAIWPFLILLACVSACGGSGGGGDGGAAGAYTVTYRVETTLQDSLEYVIYTDANGDTVRVDDAPCSADQWSRSISVDDGAGLSLTAKLYEDTSNNGTPIRVIIEVNAREIGLQASYGTGVLATVSGILDMDGPVPVLR
ncbi:MAG TPA: hypothetical protein PLR71_05220 [Deltaproteobacteria bacterium]|nr:hypothetical protein [Deltaproteobacteria bacterium]HQI80946.1 hypothetical protein [Deltaproteobacteria bacterium]